ncbi:MAG: formylglycine-generating enzyme family protein [Promethearchaeota archaeon]|jgi:formylglycine-generating enzyme required for sulfatase activity
MNKKSYFLLITILGCSLLSPLILKYYCFTQENLNGEIKSASLTLHSQGLKMVFIKGGSFDMGDVFDEGGENEKPNHRVTVDDFYIAKYEVTVGQFKKFIKKTGYITSSENPFDSLKQLNLIMEIMRIANEKGPDTEDVIALSNEFLSFGGTYYWDTENKQFGFSGDVNWRTPGFEQSENDPVISLSWVDAINFCNWLSEKEGLPVAYDVETYELLDMTGKPTNDIGEVKGYRLPTEAEWEYAARDGGKKVRFGNSQNIARSNEICFDASVGDYSYLEKGECRIRTTPVGSFKPNGLGLYDMSGNAWEWCSDCYRSYNPEAQVNPYISDGYKRVLRGGRWGGNAFGIRVFIRQSWEPTNRCNNSGFRVARSK